MNKNTIWFDSHCHLDLLNNEEIEKIKNFKNFNFVIPAIYPDYKNSEILSEKLPNTYFTIGCHPLFLKNLKLNDAENIIKKLLKNNKHCIGIGEIGLDYFNKNYNKEKQIDFFKMQLDIADSYKCPIIIHLRKAFDDFYKIMENYKNLKIIMHMYGGSLEITKQYLKKFENMYFSFGGPHIRKNNTKTKEILKILPKEKILIETDSPDLPPVGFEKPNTPLNLPFIGEKIGYLLGICIENLAKLTYKNSKEAFSWKTTWKD